MVLPCSGTRKGTRYKARGTSVGIETEVQSDLRRQQVGKRFGGVDGSLGSDPMVDREEEKVTAGR